MSLHHLAKHMQSAGRGEDKVLVHMTPKEVQGLQSLAMSHGGSLTINPQTGLPEAGFLSSILPTLLGVGLSIASGGALTPLMSAGLVGGGTALATGSLQKGLMAGLGAYGGAGLGAGLAGAGAAGAEAGLGALSSVPQASIPAALPGVVPEAAASMIPSAATPLAQAVNTAGAANMSSLAGASPATSMFAPQLTAANQAVSIAQAAPTFESTMANAGRGFSGLTSPSGIEAVWNAMPKGSGLALGTSLLGAMTPDKLNAPKPDQGMIRPYTMERTQNPEAYAQTNAPVYGQPFDSSERQYFTDQYTAGTPYKAPGPEYKATGGLTALAVGGPVEEMAAQNAVGANTMYPQSGYQTPMYANPQISRPTASNVIGPSGDVEVDPYTGEQKFADGGTTSFSYNPQTQQFTRQAPAVGSMATMPTSNGNIPYLSGVGPEGQHGLFSKMAAQIAAHQPQVGSTVSGGVSAPMYQAAPQPAPQYVNYQQAAPQMQQAQPDNMQGFYDYMQNQMGGMQGYAAGGMTDGHLGSYSDGGRLLRGPGDGVSDDIPATIGDKQPARLADGEFVVPARIVSELGNGSTEAGARQLYKMMERVQHNRRKSVGKDKAAVDAKSAQYLPA